MITSGIPPDLRTALHFHKMGQFDKAANIYREILVHNPGNYDALHYLGLLEAQQDHFERASPLLARALELQPANKQVRANYATTLVKAGHNDSAIQTCDEGLRLEPTNVYLLYLSAIALFKSRRLPESLRRFNQLLTIQPDHVIAINERGSVLAEMKEYEQALAAFQKAVTLNPKFADAHLNLGNLFGKLEQRQEAKASFEKALELNPKLARAWSGLGNILRKRRAFDEALAAFAKALALESDLVEAWFGRGNVYTDLKQHDNAFAAYDRAFTLSSHLDYAEGARLHAKMHLCDWGKIEADFLHILSAVRHHKSASSPFFLLSTPASSADQLQCAKTYVADQGSFPALWRGEIYAHDRIRLAYLSADFHDHAVMYLIAGLFEQHDKSRFEVSAISFGPDSSSEIRRRITDAVEHFIDVRDKTDQQIAKLLRELEIDIAIDLMGLTQNARLGVFARRPAPVQVNYLGYPGTLGAEYNDYIIGDSTVTPPEHFKYYSEQVVSLPDSYQVNDGARPIAQRAPSRTECGLPDTAFVYCCFNNLYKILPNIFDVWMRLLRARENSVLWLIEGHPTACINLRREAEKRGVSAERLIFARQMPLSEHLARHRHADLFLDTLPYNAHTTASDALWAGVPVLTCVGTTFAGRVAASLLKSIGLNELITYSLGEYEILALKLARDSSLLGSINGQLARNKSTHPLFNTKRFARHIEKAYLGMWERHQRREPPEAFTVAPVN
jgi:protein O-GlcNAc transferase